MKTTNTFKALATAARYNSGRHFLDSGDHYGRHYDKPEITPESPAVTIDLWGKSITATISTVHLLADHCEHDKAVQRRFDHWVSKDENSELSWFEAGEKFVTEKLGLKQHARDNTYNGENDLNQVYIWEVYSADESSDWIYCEEPLLVVYIHTGCDVRGGYSYPLFLRPRGEYACGPVDLCAEFYISEGRDAEGCDLSSDECQSLDEHWRNGWSSHPASELERDIERVFHFTKKTDSVIVKLHSGEVVRVHADFSRCY